MYGRIRAFLRLRRQNDTVKIIGILALAGAVSFASALYHAREIYHYVDTPAEYVLTGEGAVSKKRVDELRQREGVAAVSRQMERPVTVMYRGTPADMSCTALSREYMERLFGAELLNGTKKIFMNEAAFSEWKRALEEKNGETAYLGEADGEDVKTFDIRYALAEEAGGIRAAEGSEGADAGVSVSAGVPAFKSAQLVVVKGGEESFICMAEDEGILLRQADSLRVTYAKHDLDGLHVETLRKLGYALENEETVTAGEYEVEVKLLHIRYGLLLCAVCAVSACALKRRLSFR